MSYHRIGSATVDPYYAPMFSATRDDFAAEVRYLCGHFRLLGPEGIPSLAEPDYVPTEPTAVITFDDGYRDNVELALPVLQSLSAPAAFFITTDFIDRPRLPWWDHVALVVWRSQLDRLVLELPEPLMIDLRQNSGSAAVASVINAFLRSDPNDEIRNLTHLNERAGVEIDANALGRSLFMTWDDVRALESAGMIVGSHTVAHLNLARQTEDAQAASLIDSRRILERELSHEVRTLAYPYGGFNDFTETTQRLARDAGYRIAFSLKNQRARPGAHLPFDIPRLVIGSSDTTTLFRARMCLCTSFGSSVL